MITKYRKSVCYEQIAERTGELIHDICMVN
ncbi:hypothetical protein JW960_29675 [candidate division KSB1 bacterium]|nr:hypothetical protein [candidate division KSB1 bacterium]